VDAEGFQTLYRLAAAMGLPVVNEINKMEIVDGKATVGHEIGGGAREVPRGAPCLVCWAPPKASTNRAIPNFPTS
jgi:electron transfer flavoprotein alpha/beta subunit